MAPTPQSHPNDTTLRDFLTGRVTLREVSAIAAHLDDCPQCCALLETFGDNPDNNRLVEAVYRAKRTIRPDTVTTDESSPGPPIGVAGAPELPGLEILAELGRGGAGVVYKARQIAVHRIVAAKVILGGDLAGPAAMVRFGAEAEAAARVNHPNVIQLYEVGRFVDQPYLVMEYAEGGNLTERIRGRAMEPREAATLVLAITEGVAAVHEKGLVHRDLKPANVLLTREGQPKITDFGLVRQLEGGHALTATGLVAGTPSYMSPEQAEGRSREVGPGSDIWAIGVMLYEMLTGHPPFQAPSIVETLRQVAEVEPVAPRVLQPTVPIDIDTICLKCLRKEPARRYSSAKELAEDLARFLQGRPILARRVGWWEQLWLWARRRPKVAALIALAVGSLVCGAVVAGVMALRAEWALTRSIASESRAVESEKKTHLVLADLYAFQGLQAAQAGDDRAAALWCARAALEARGDPHRRQTNALRFRTYSQRVGRTVAAFPPLPGYLATLTFHPGGRYLLAERHSRQGPTVLAIDTERPLPWPSEYGEVSAAAWSADGSLLAIGGAGGQVGIFSFPELKELQRFHAGGKPDLLRFRPDGGHLAVASLNYLRIWDRKDGAWREAVDHVEFLRTLAYSGDGTRLVTTTWDGQLRSFAAGDRLALEYTCPIYRIPLPITPSGSVHILPDGNLLVMKAEDRLDRIDPRTRSVLRTYSLGIAPRDIHISPDGGLLAACENRTTILYDLDRGAVRHVRTPGQSGRDVSVRFNANGTRLLAGGYSGATLLSVGELRVLPSPAVDPTGLQAVAFAPAGDLLATANFDGWVRVWRLPALDEVRIAGESILGRFHPDGRRLLVLLQQQNRSFVWDLEARTSTGFAIGPLAGSPRDAWFPPGGDEVVFVCGGPGKPKTVERRSLKTGFRIGDPLTFDAACERWQGDAARSQLALGGLDGKVRLIDLATWRVRWEGQAPGPAMHFAFLGAGPRLAVASENPNRVVVFAAASGEKVSSLEGTPGVAEPEKPPTCLLSPQGDGLVADSTLGHEVIVRNLGTGARHCPPLPHPDRAWPEAFSDDGRLLVTRCLDGLCRVWNLDDGTSAGRPVRPEENRISTKLVSAQLSQLTPDRRWLVTSYLDGGVEVWDWRLGHRLFPRRETGDAYATANRREPTLEIQQDNRWLAVAGFPFMNVLRLVDPDPADEEPAEELLERATMLSFRRIREGENLEYMTDREWMDLWNKLCPQANGAEEPPPK